MKLWSNNNMDKGVGGFNPERRLLSAVLQRAITDFVYGDGELQEAARDWLYEANAINAINNIDPTEDHFGFSFICEALDFHKEELRKAVQRQLSSYRQAQALEGDSISDATKNSSVG